MGQAEAAAVRDAFNRIGGSIDEVPLRNPTAAWMRERTRHELVRTFRTPSSLLEVGCGTGADAAYLARRGHHVVALDVSDRMAELAERRVRASALDGSVVVLRGRLVDVIGEVEASRWAPFAGAYANFSLAYEDSLTEVASQVHRLLARGGWFLFTVPNRICWAEGLLCVARFRTQPLLARLRSPGHRTLSGVTVPVHAYTVAEVRHALRGLFRLEGVLGLPVFAPPPGYHRPGVEGYLRPLRSLDARFAGMFPWSVLGDHLLFRFQKIEG